MEALRETVVVCLLAIEDMGKARPLDQLLDYGMMVLWNDKKLRSSEPTYLGNIRNCDVCPEVTTIRLPAAASWLDAEVAQFRPLIELNLNLFAVRQTFLPLFSTLHTYRHWEKY